MILWAQYRKQSESYCLQVIVNQKPIQIELDTDASLSLINKQTFDAIADHGHIVIKATDIHLKT